MIGRFLPLIGTGILVALATFLGLKSVAVFETKIATPSESATSNEPVAAISPAPIPQRPAVYYAAITERPLFNPSRRPNVSETAEPTPEPVSETPAPAAPAEIPPPDLALQGVITGDGQNAALISINGEMPVWVTQGAPIADWTLGKIGTDWIEISRAARNIRVDMYK